MKKNLGEAPIPIAKFVLIVSCFFCAHAFVLGPAWWRMTQAREILCGGKRNFVFMKDPAFRIIQAMPTNKEAPGTWSVEELNILALARPPLESKFGWEFPAPVVAAMPQWGVESALALTPAVQGLGPGGDGVQ